MSPSAEKRTDAGPPAALGAAVSLGVWMAEVGAAEVGAAEVGAAEVPADDAGGEVRGDGDVPASGLLQALAAISTATPSSAALVPRERLMTPSSASSAQVVAPGDHFRTHAGRQASATRSR